MSDCVQPEDPDIVVESSAVKTKSDMRKHCNSLLTVFCECQVQYLHCFFLEHLDAQADQLFISFRRLTTDLPIVFLFISGQPSLLVVFGFRSVVGKTNGCDGVDVGLPYSD